VDYKPGSEGVSRFDVVQEGEARNGGEVERSDLAYLPFDDLQDRARELYESTHGPTPHGRQHIATAGRDELARIITELEGLFQEAKQRREPPNLRRITEGNACANCAMFEESGECAMFWNYPVSEGEVCDEHISEDDEEEIEEAADVNLVEAAEEGTLEVSPEDAHWREFASDFLEGRGRSQPRKPRGSGDGNRDGRGDGGQFASTRGGGDLIPEFDEDELGDAADEAVLDKGYAKEPHEEAVLKAASTDPRVIAARKKVAEYQKKYGTLEKRQQAEQERREKHRRRQENQVKAGPSSNVRAHVAHLRRKGATNVKVHLGGVSHGNTRRDWVIDYTLNGERKRDVQGPNGGWRRR
jgi:hypothetical protein